MDNYILTNGIFYVGRSFKGNLITNITNIKNAEVMSYEKAQNIKNSNIPQNEKDEWKIITLPQSTIKEIIKPDKTIDFDWEAFRAQVLNLYDYILEYKEQLNKLLKQVDMELSDIHHIIRESKSDEKISSIVYKEQYKREVFRKTVKRHIRYSNIIIKFMNERMTLEELAEEFLDKDDKPYSARTSLFEEIAAQITEG